MIRIFLLFIACVLGIAAVFAGLVCLKASRSFENLRRVDEGGTLYFADYTGNYYDPLISLPFRLFRGGGCSAFIAENEKGEIITGRNYDLPHKDADGNVTGLNVVVKCRPKGRYSSVNIADAAFISFLKLPYFKGALDGGVTKLPLVLLPYLCMDGLNEKGLCVSILALDTKPGEKPVCQKQPGKKTVMINQLLRILLDSCSCLDEAAETAGTYNLVSTFNYDYHLFVSDAFGDSAVFEWRNNSFTVTKTNASTNFYVGYDDACDCYYGDRLKERFEAYTGTKRNYRYGYGHGYARFAEVVKTLDGHNTPEKLTAVMNEDEVFALLERVAQDYDPEELTSHTQYSAVYNSTTLTADVCAMRNFKEHYVFAVD